MDTLLEAESKALIDEDGIREEVDTFTFEGHDTVSTSTTFLLMLLAHHPEAQKGILEEIKSSENLLNGNYDVNHVANMKYFDRVVKESLRLYPPGFFIARMLSENVTIGEKDF